MWLYNSWVGYEAIYAMEGSTVLTTGYILLTDKASYFYMIISFSHYCVIRANIKEKKGEEKVTREMRQTK